MKTKFLPQVGLAGWLMFALACQSAPPQSVRQSTSQALQASPTALATVTPSPVAAPVTIKFAHIVPVSRPQGLQSTTMSFGKLNLKQKLPANAEVSLVPLGAALSASTTRVTNVVAMENPCSESLPKRYETELAPITEAAWLKAVTAPDDKRFTENAPFDVCVIYPAVTAARALERSVFEKARLPKKVLLHHIVAALDVTGDEQPEVLLVEYCCDKPQAQRNECDLTCSAVYVRAPNGVWRIAETQTPC
jgi:hypothetical protein